MTNYYKVLGVRNFAPIEEIKTAYRKLSKKFHPDLNEGDKFFEERFKEIQEAYEALNDSYRRRAIDDYLKQNTSNKSSESQSYQRKAEPTSNNSKSSNSQYSKPNSEEYKQTHTTAAEPQKSEGKNLNPQFLAFILIAGIICLLIILGKKRNSNQTISSNRTYNNTYEPSVPKYENKDNYESPLTSKNISYEKFSIGSSKKEVLAIQGSPSRTSKFEPFNEETWYYGNSSVTFKNGKVKEYSDDGNNLSVQYSKDVSSSEKLTNFNVENFSIGSSKKEVLEIQGSPNRTSKFEPFNEETWYYGNSNVTFKNGKVKEYSDDGNNLNVQYSKDLSTSEIPSEFDYFSIGSSKKEVLAIQGSPNRTSKFEPFNEETWFYGYSSVTFKNGKVKEYSNDRNNLKVKY